MTHAAWSLVETPTFLADVDRLWTEDERLEFFQWLANHPDVGRLIPGSGGCRKTRRSRSGTGKRGGVRVIYCVRADIKEIWLLLIYAETSTANVPAYPRPRSPERSEFPCAPCRTGNEGAERLPAQRTR
jgi:hypothetical protein